MIILNVEINGLIKFLMDIELSGKQSRMRTRFCKLIGERLKEIEEERFKLIDKYVKKDEEGNFLTKEKNGIQIYDIENIESFNKEYEELMREELVIDETNERKEMLLTVRDILLNTEQTFKGQDAMNYDRYCEIFENLQYNN